MTRDEALTVAERVVSDMVADGSWDVASDNDAFVRGLDVDDLVDVVRAMANLAAALYHAMRVAIADLPDYEALPDPVCSVEHRHREALGLIVDLLRGTRPPDDVDPDA